MEEKLKKKKRELDLRAIGWSNLQEIRLTSRVKE